MMKKLLLVALALLTVLSCIAMPSCSDNSDTDNTSTTTPDTDVIAGPVDETTAAPYSKKDNLPEMNFNGEEVRILVWQSIENEFYFDSDTGETIDSSIYYRNTEVKNRMAVELEYEMIPGNASHGDSYIGTVQKSVMSGEKAYDLAGFYARWGMSAAISGYLMNVADSEYIDFSADWYKKAIIDAATIGNKTYTFAGDMSHSSISRASGIFFNVDMITDYGLEDPYQLVLDGKWTVDKLHEMISGRYTDVDGNGTKNKGDIFGIVTDNVQMDCTQYAGGVRFSVKDENNNPKLSPDLTGEKIITLIDKWISVMNTAGLEVKTDDTSVWGEGQTLFYVYPLAAVRNAEWKNAPFTYGFIPQPKFDEQQDRYIASLTNYFTLWGIPAAVKDETRCEMLVECMSSEGYHYITPAVFETAYKYKYSSDETQRQSVIFDMIRDNICCDFGKICTSTFDTLPSHMYSDTVLGGFNNFKSRFTANQRKIQKKLDSIISEVESR